MYMSTDQSITPNPKLHWYRLTPGRLLVVLLVVEAVLRLSERFRWFSFNKEKGWTVLIAMAAVGLFLLLMLFWFLLSLVSRLRFQFSIRTLLLLTVVVAIPSNWLAVEMKRAKEKEAVVESLRKMGGIVLYDYQANDYMPVRTPAWLYNVFGNSFFSEVYNILLDGTKVTNDDLLCLQKLQQARVLTLNSTTITDTGLKHLETLERLEHLDLSNTQVTDGGLKHLKEWYNLRHLRLSKTHVTNAGVAELQKALPGCNITH